MLASKKMYNLYTIQGWRCYGLCKPRRTDWSRAFVPPGAKTFEDYRDRTNYSEEDYEPLLPSSNGIVQKMFIQFIAALLYYTILKPCSTFFQAALVVIKNKALYYVFLTFSLVCGVLCSNTLAYQKMIHIHQNQTLYQQGVLKVVIFN